MNVHHRYRHPNDPDGNEPDCHGYVGRLTVEEVPFAGYAWIWIAQVEVVGTGGEGYRISTIRAGDPWRELNRDDPTDKLAWDAIAARITDEDVAEAFERG